MESSHSWENSLGHKKLIEDITSTRKCWWVGKADRGTEGRTEGQVLPGAQLSCLSRSQGATGAQCLQGELGHWVQKSVYQGWDTMVGLPSPGLGPLS